MTQAQLITNMHNRFLDPPTKLRFIVSSTEDRLCGATDITHYIRRYISRALVQVFARRVFPVL
jgi:hypothetical protein